MRLLFFSNGWGSTSTVLATQATHPRAPPHPPARLWQDPSPLHVMREHRPMFGPVQEGWLQPCQRARTVQGTWLSRAGNPKPNQRLPLPTPHSAGARCRTPLPCPAAAKYITVPTWFTYLQHVEHDDEPVLHPTTPTPQTKSVFTSNQSYCLLLSFEGEGGGGVLCFSLTVPWYLAPPIPYLSSPSTPCIYFVLTFS
jgi:hypothetical protein